MPGQRKRWDEPWPEPTLVDPSLNTIALLFRFLGWLWMALLVILGLTAAPTSQAAIGKPEIAIAALVIATIWTALTFVAARAGWLKSLIFITLDLFVALAIGMASLLADTDVLFHGGYPMSWVVVAAAGGGIIWALPGSLFLMVEQLVVRFNFGHSVSGAVFAIVFPIIALVAGRGFDSLREQSVARTRAEARLARSEAEKARLEERERLADQLHDSVLQSLLAIRMASEDAREVAYLARRQERELRRTIHQFRSPYDQSFRVSLLAARDDVEDLHHVKIESNIRSDVPLTPALNAGIEAAREAMINAARHSGAPRIDLYSESRDGDIVISIRDRGSGFNPGEALGGDGHGLSHSMRAAVERQGGSVIVDSAPGSGTEITIQVPSSETIETD